MASRQEVAQALSILVAAYPNSKIIPSTKDVPGTLDVYLAMLQDLSLDQLLKAIKYCIQTQPDFLPSVATIRQANDKIKELCGPEDISGQEAWGIVLAEVRRAGTWKQWAFDDERITKAVECVGWRAICMSDEDDPAVRSQFIRAFERIAQRKKEYRIVEQISGRGEQLFMLTGEVAKKLSGGK